MKQESWVWWIFISQIRKLRLQAIREFSRPPLSFLVFLFISEFCSSSLRNQFLFLNIIFPLCKVAPNSAKNRCLKRIQTKTILSGRIYADNNDMFLTYLKCTHLHLFIFHFCRSCGCSPGKKRTETFACITTVDKNMQAENQHRAKSRAIGSWCPGRVHGFPVEDHMLPQRCKDIY